MSVPALVDGSAEPLDRTRLDGALARIAAGADALDRHPAFPYAAFDELASAGVLGATLPGPAGENAQRISFGDELRLVREVSRADGSVGRILDGHFNAVERLTVACPRALEDDARARAQIAAGELRLGVWGADPAPGEGEPASLRDGEGVITLRGVKTFCSGAGGVHRALVVARDDAGERRLACVDTATEATTVDRSWYRGEGLRASESHRVVFDGAPVLAVLGGPGEASREPWFSRDAIRTSATWAGIADSVLEAALAFLGVRGKPNDIAALAAGRMRVAAGTIDRWLDHAATHAEATGTGNAGTRGEARRPLAATAIEARWAIAAAARELAAEAALACGSRPLATGGNLSRGRRDLDLFLLQHRLEPLLARHGAAAIGEGEGR